MRKYYFIGEGSCASVKCPKDDAKQIKALLTGDDSIEVDVFGFWLYKLGCRKLAREFQIFNK